MSTSRQTNIENVANSYKELTLNLKKEIFCHTLGSIIYPMDDLGLRAMQNKPELCLLYEFFKIYLRL